MKKKIVIIGFVMPLCMLVQTTIQAQDIKGNNYINAGIGVGTFGFSGTGGLPITVSFEHGFTDKISAGLGFGFVQRKFTESYKYTYLVFGARGSYHFNELLNIQNNKLDTYGGASLFYRHFKLNYDDQNVYKTSGGAIGLGIHIGGRYFFSERVGGFAELGYGISPLQLGISFGL